MSDSLKYEFDLKGWILLPALLTEEQLEPIRAHQLKLKYDRESLAPALRDTHAGPSQVLLDHPVVVGVLNEILSNQSLASEDCYGFRMDHTGVRAFSVTPSSALSQLVALGGRCAVSPLDAREGWKCVGSPRRRRFLQLPRQLSHVCTNP
jgi:hypothetical protein